MIYGDHTVFKVIHIHTCTEILDAIDAEQEKVRAALKIHDYNAMAETFTEDCQFIAPGSPAIKGRAGEISYYD